MDKYLVFIFTFIFSTLSLSSECKDFDQKKIESKIDALISSSRGCHIDSDCQTVNLGCPFGCKTGITKNSDNLAMIHENIGLIERCGDRCIYKCPSDSHLVTKCIESMCTVQMVLPSE